VLLRDAPERVFRPLVFINIHCTVRPCSPSPSLPLPPCRQWRAEALGDTPTSSPCPWPSPPTPPRPPLHSLPRHHPGPAGCPPAQARVPHRPVSAPLWPSCNAPPPRIHIPLDQPRAPGACLKTEMLSWTKREGQGKGKGGAEGGPGAGPGVGAGVPSSVPASTEARERGGSMRARGACARWGGTPLIFLGNPRQLHISHGPVVRLALEPRESLLRAGRLRCVRPQYSIVVPFFWLYIVLYCAYCTVLYSTLLYGTVPYCIVMNCSVLYCTCSSLLPQECRGAVHEALEGRPLALHFAHLVSGGTWTGVGKAGSRVGCDRKRRSGQKALCQCTVLYCIIIPTWDCDL